MVSPRTPNFGIHVAVVTLSSLFLATAPSPASACGGLFCNGSQPVNQTAERIVFSVNDDDTTSAIIEIRYEGEAMDFAWVLPVPGTPDVGVSSTQALDRIQQLTNPSYRLQVTVEGTCRTQEFADAGFDAATTADASSGDGGGGPPVRVLDSGSVGPFDFATIAVDPATADPADAALTWLTDNGFAVTPMTAEVLGPYLAGGLNLIAFRLSKGNDVGAIRPVLLRYTGSTPMIPIRPTALAATDDMGILVWVLGPARAVPTNYLSLELNESHIDWFRPSAGYAALVSAAADEAGGQGFVTEMSNSTLLFTEAAFPGWQGRLWASLTEMDWTGRDGELLDNLLANFGSMDGAREALDATVPNDVLSCTPPADGPGWDRVPGRSCFYSIEDIVGMEPAVVLAEFERMVIEPLRATQAILDGQPRFTRLFTTMSAEEMTVDPFFDFNADLPAVSNQHVAERIIECNPDVWFSDAPWRTVLASGDVVRGVGGSWPTALLSAELPANDRILRYGTSGPGAVLEDNGDAIEAAIRMANARYPAGSRGSRDAGPCEGDPESCSPESDAGTSDSGADAGPTGGGGGCSVGSGAPSHGVLFIVLGLIGLLWRRQLVS